MIMIFVSSSKKSRRADIGLLLFSSQIDVLSSLGINYNIVMLPTIMIIMIIVTVMIIMIIMTIMILNVVNTNNCPHYYTESRVALMSNTKKPLIDSTKTLCLSQCMTVYRATKNLKNVTLKYGSVRNKLLTTKRFPGTEAVMSCPALSVNFPRVLQ